MATKSVKLVDLKVADLKRELEERDLDTTGTKSVLQQRLREAISAAGDDPEVLVFETTCGSSDLGKLLCNMETRLLENSNEMKNEIENKLQQNSNELKNEIENKLQQNSNDLKNEIDNKLQDIDNKLQENSNDLKNELQQCVGNLEDKYNNLETELVKIKDDLDSKLSRQTADFDNRIREIEARLEDRVQALQTHTPLTAASSPSLSALPEVSAPAHATPAHVITSAPTTSGIPTFDGKIPWEDYMALFETAAMVHGWTAAAKASMLCLSLRGDALGVLQTIPLVERRNYEELVKRLEMRYGHKHMDQLYRSQLRSRVQRSGESLQEFEADIARLVRNAYPMATDDIYESLAVDRFLDGLREPETQQAVKLARPKTLNDALTQALEFEAVRQSVRGQARVRATTSEETDKFSIEDIVRKVLEKLSRRKRELRCWSCGELGHPRSKCRAQAPVAQEQEN